MSRQWAGTRPLEVALKTIVSGCQSRNQNWRKIVLEVLKMSWEVMQTRTSTCDCGAGTETYTFELDDWNRTRSSTEIHCLVCHEKSEEKLEGDLKRQERREWLLQRSQQLASERYSAQWIDLFAGMTKKAAWLRYTGGLGYPTLGTFYQHVNDAGGLNEHLTWCLINDLERSLRILNLEDLEIKELLGEREQLWQPTSKSM
jgi:hypothetical protein